MRIDGKLDGDYWVSSLGRVKISALPPYLPYEFSKAKRTKSGGIDMRTREARWLASRANDVILQARFMLEVA